MPRWKSIIVDKDKINEERMIVVEPKDGGKKFLVSIPICEWAKREMKRIFTDRNNPGSLSNKIREDWQKEQIAQGDGLRADVKRLKETISDKRDNGEPTADIVALETELYDKQSRLQKINEIQEAADAVSWAMGKEVPKPTVAEKSEEDLAVEEALGIKDEKKKPGRPKKEVVSV